MCGDFQLDSARPSSRAAATWLRSTPSWRSRWSSGCLSPRSQLDKDESYTLSVPADGSAITIHASNIYGAYHALNSLLFLIQFDPVSAMYIIKHAPYKIADKPFLSVAFSLPSHAVSRSDDRQLATLPAAASDQAHGGRDGVGEAERAALAPGGRRGLPHAVPQPADAVGGRLLAPGALHEGRSLFSLSLRSISRRWWRTRARGESTWFRSSTCRVTRPRGASAVRVRG